MSTSNSSGTSPPLKSSGRALKVLVVEDNPINQRVAKGLISRLGHDVSVADDGRAAVAAVENNDFDLVFMDIHMPVMDGIAATQAIRALPSPKGTIPIVAMTAKALAGDREDCLAAGMDDYLAKPVHRDALTACLNSWAGGRDGNTGAIGPSVDRNSLYDRAIIDDLRKVAGDAGLTELLKTLLETADKQLSEMETALANDTTQTVERIAHSLRGAAANMGLVALSRNAAEIARHAADGNPESAISAIEKARALLATYQVMRP